MSAHAAPERLRILYVLPYVPSPIRVRPYQIIRALAEQGHEITVAALADGKTADASALAELRRVCRAVHIVPLPRLNSAMRAAGSVPTPKPLWAAWCESPQMDRLLRRLAATEEFDLAHVEHLRAAHFDRALDPLPRLLDAVDCITELRRQMAVQRGGASAANRLLSRFEWRKLLRYEPRAYRPYRAITVTSEHDARALTALDPLLPPIEIIPNGVDLEYFSPQNVPVEANRIVFSGKMSYSANDDAARYLLTQILPCLRELVPGVRVTIAGSAPSSALVRCAERVGGVDITGYVDDLRPFLRGAAVAVCPMRIGVGVQNKALEAMAVGRPVVCTPLAARALANAAEPALFVAESAPDFAAACARLLGSPEMAHAGGRAGRGYVEKYHHWKTTADRFVMLYSKVRSNWQP